MTSTAKRSETYSDAEKEPVRPKESIDEVELRPDAEDRFRKAVHAAAKSGPKHRPAKR